MNASTVTAYEKAVAHFSLGIGLYAVIGGLQYAADTVAKFHPGTATNLVIIVAVSEAIQAAIKGVQAKKAAFDASPDVTIASTFPDGTPVA